MCVCACVREFSIDVVVKLPVQITFPSSYNVSVMKRLLNIRCFDFIYIILDTLNVTFDIFDTLIDDLGVC